VHLRGEPGVDAIKALRALLKSALRRFGLRAIDVRECALTHVEDERALAPTREDPMSAFSERIRGQKTGLFKVADFAGGREAALTIDYLEENVEMFGEEIDVLCFVETKQQLRVNQTNAEFLLNALGDDPKKWKGQHVVLYLAEYAYRGESGYTIRIKLRGNEQPAAKEGTIIPPARGDGASKSTARSSSPQRDRKTDLDDEIPW